MSDNTPFQTDADRLADYWIKKNQTEADQRPKIPAHAIARLGNCYPGPAKREMKEGSHIWHGEGLLLPPGSKFGPDKSKLVNGEK